VPPRSFCLELRARPARARRPDRRRSSPRPQGAPLPVSLRSAPARTRSRAIATCPATIAPTAPFISTTTAPSWPGCSPGRSPSSPATRSALPGPGPARSRCRGSFGGL